MDDRPTLDQINLVVRNMGPVVEFYRLLGVDVDEPPAPWDEHHRTVETAAGLDLDIDSCRFASQWNEGWPDNHGGAVLGFRVIDRDTVDAIYTRLTSAGYPGQQPPYDAFWGARYAVVADPDGNCVGIMSRVDPERRTRPPDPV
jgi:uncharacterized glyoxalase superfamily protein PhnB